jgi:peptidoglycan/xylan/chitin deacetylase (PgdA/CDA1 family)
VLTQEGASRSAASIAQDIVKQVQPGSIILLHPMYDHTATTRAAIPLIVEQLRAQGYRFVTVPELLTYQ